MNFLQKYKLYRNVRDSINSVGHMRGLFDEQYSIIEDDKEIVCRHNNAYYNCEPADTSYMSIKNFDDNKTELVRGRFAHIMFNLLEKKNRKQVKSR